MKVVLVEKVKDISRYMRSSGQIYNSILFTKLNDCIIGAYASDGGSGGVVYTRKDARRILAGQKPEHYHRYGGSCDAYDRLLLSVKKADRKTSVKKT